VAKTAGLESCGRRSVVDMIYMGEVESFCAYWAPLYDWKGETAYLKARVVNNIAKLLGCENPQLAAA
jgi:hypothetical protein